MSSSIFFKEKFPAWIKSNRFLVTTTASLIVNLFLLDSISIKLVLIENIYIYSLLHGSKYNAANVFRVFH